MVGIPVSVGCGLADAIRTYLAAVLRTGPLLRLPVSSRGTAFPSPRCPPGGGPVAGGAVVGRRHRAYRGSGLRQSTRGRDESPRPSSRPPYGCPRSAAGAPLSAPAASPGPDVAPGRLPSAGVPALRRPHLAAASGSAPPLLAPNRSATPGGPPADVPLRRQPGTHRVPLPLAGCRPPPPGSIPASHRPPLALRPVGSPGWSPLHLSSPVLPSPERVSVGVPARAPSGISPGTLSSPSFACMRSRPPRRQQLPGDFFQEFSGRAAARRRAPHFPRSITSAGHRIGAGQIAAGQHFCGQARQRRIAVAQMPPAGADHRRPEGEDAGGRKGGQRTARKEPERKAAGKGKQPVRRNRPVSRNPQKS